VLVQVKLLSAVRHANLCRYYACSTNGPQKCLLLELMAVALDKRLVAEPALGWQQCVHIALSICRGLSHLHSLSPPIIHRDTKSQNVLLNGFTTAALDEVSEAKVADFGTVRASHMRIMEGLTTDGKLKTDGKTHAVTGHVVGTGPYMPWEYAGFGHVSEKTDAFAMGIVVIELLIFGSMPNAAPEDFPFKARDLVNTEDAADLSALLQARAVSSGWAEGNAKRAAEILADVAVVCTQKTGKRQTPTEVMSQLESARALAQ
jgi:serine/threonine protein kinase